VPDAGRAGPLTNGAHRMDPTALPQPDFFDVDSGSNGQSDFFSMRLPLHGRRAFDNQLPGKGQRIQFPATRHRRRLTHFYLTMKSSNVLVERENCPSHSRKLYRIDRNSVLGGATPGKSAAQATVDQIVCDYVMAMLRALADRYFAKCD
jgi:hypothetical protein